MKKVSTVITSLMLTLCLALGALPLSTLAAESAAPLTRAEARDLMLAYADDYNPAATAASVLRGYADGTTKEENPILRIEALVMLARAFGPFQAPDHYWSTATYKNVAFTDVPAWAESDLAALVNARLLAPAADGLLRPYEAINRDELERLLRRVFAMAGSNPKDDFFSSSLRPALNDIVIADGQRSGGVTETMWVKTVDEIETLIKKIVASTPAAGTAEHTIKALYTTYMDTEGRDKSSRAFMAPYLTAIDEATTIQQLEAVRIDYLKATGQSLLCQPTLGASEADSNKYVTWLVAPKSRFGVEFFAQGNEGQQADYQTYLTKVLTLSGDSTASATATATAYFDYDRTVATAELLPEERYNPTDSSNYIPFATLQEQLKNFDLTQTYALSSITPDAEIVVADLGALEVIADLWTQENIAQAKAALRVASILSLGSGLGEAYYEARVELNNALYGYVKPVTLEMRGVTMLQDNLYEELGERYVAAFFPTQAKTAVATMTEELLEIYAKRIDKLDWMTDATKTMAKKKISTMDANMGYPDQWDDTNRQAALQTAEEGGTFLANACAMSKTQVATNAATQASPVDKEVWYMAAYDINAYYDGSANSVNFTAAFLQPPMYDADTSLSTQLGAIGAVIGHEVSHGFDDTGSQYNELGNVVNWWTEEDADAFALRCQAVADFYDGWEAAPGIAMNGTRTLAENLADIAGLTAALDLLESKEENPDYKAFFNAYAVTWLTLTSPDFAQYRYATDTHAAPNLRVNRVVVHFQQFFDAFGITEDDAMYVAPADRISIW